jgi:hypothetical protein
MLVVPLMDSFSFIILKQFTDLLKKEKREFFRSFFFWNKINIGNQTLPSSLLLVEHL